MARTLLQLRTGALRRADMVNSRLISESEANDYINNAITDLYDMIVQVQGQEWYLRELTFPTVVNQASYTIDSQADFYLLKLVEVELADGNRIPLSPYMPQERNLSQLGLVTTGLSGNWPWDSRYRLRGDVNTTTGVYDSVIRFDPAPTSVLNVYLTYVPAVPVLDLDTDVWDGFNGWEEYIEVDAAIRFLAKEDSDTTHLVQRRALLQRRIMAIAAQRDQTWSERVVDVESLKEAARYPWGRVS